MQKNYEREENNDRPTLCISNGGQRAKKETNMNKINGSVKMKESAENPATAHTLDRYL